MQLSSVKKLSFTAVCAALCLVLPMAFHSIPNAGTVFLPMHIPVLICGFVVGPWAGLIVGAVTPLLRSVLFAMPPMYPAAISMAFELAAYGFLTGLLYRMMPKKPVYIYVSLLISMVLGRVVWGIVRFLMAGLGGSEFSMAAFWAGGVTGAIPGIILQILIIPVIVMALKRAKLIEK